VKATLCNGWRNFTVFHKCSMTEWFHWKLSWMDKQRRREIQTPTSGGVNFTNALQAAFTHEDPKSKSRHWWLDCLFSLLRSLSVTASRKDVGEIDPWSFLKRDYYIAFIDSNKFNLLKSASGLVLGVSKRTFASKGVKSDLKLFEYPF